MSDVTSGKTAVFNETYMACMAWAYRENGNVPLNQTVGLWHDRFSRNGNDYEIIINPHGEPSLWLGKVLMPFELRVYPVIDHEASRYEILEADPLGVTILENWGRLFEHDIRKEMKAELDELAKEEAKEMNDATT